MLRNQACFVTQAVTQSYFTQTKSVVSVIQKNVTTLHIKLCDKARNKASGCGADGSALPWGGRGRWFKSSHSDQRRFERISFFLLYSHVFSFIRDYKPYLSRAVKNRSFLLFYSFSTNLKLPWNRFVHLLKHFLHFGKQKQVLTSMLSCGIIYPQPLIQWRFLLLVSAVCIRGILVYIANRILRSSGG